MKQKILVVGFGNEFCGDDALGPYVVRLLQEEITEVRKQKAESSRPLPVASKQKAKGAKGSSLPTAYCLLPTGISVELQTARHLDFSWAETLAGYRHLIFVDASPHQGYPLVKVKNLGAKGRGVKPNAPLTSHHISISHLLQITRELFGQEPSAHLVIVGGENFDFGGKLSLRARKSAPRAVKKILSLIRELAPAR